MSTWTTNTETKSPEELTEQQKTDWRDQMDLYSKEEAAQKNGDSSEIFKAKDLVFNGDLGDDRRIIFERGVPGSEGSIRSYIKAQFTDSELHLQADGYIRMYGVNGATETMRISNDGNMTIAGSYSPFTGTHIATSTENLQIGELVKIESQQLDNKQPLWSASYCKGAKKGVFGIVYDVVYKTETCITESEGETITSTRNTNEIEGYLIAAVGDAIVKFSNENGPCEAGDYLIPSTKLEGHVMVSNAEFVPVNQCGKAGEASTENKTIAWVKE